MAVSKPVHSLVLDAGPIIKNEPPISTLLQKAEALFTIPAVLAEIKDASARARVATTLQPFLTQRSPVPASVKTISEFARKTGDFSVLSRTDIDIIALTYELECERNQGNWRLRTAPGQKGLNGRPPIRPDLAAVVDSSTHPPQEAELSAYPETEAQADAAFHLPPDRDSISASIHTTSTRSEPVNDQASNVVAPQSTDSSNETAYSAKNQQASSPRVTSLACDKPSSTDLSLSSTTNATDDDHEDASSSDSDGWITPSNLKKRQAEDASATTVNTAEPATMQAAVLTTDFAMQNVILQMNLNLLSPSLQRVKHLKTFVLRCHACFQVTKDVSKQFCPKCGGPTLTRVSCTTDSNGEFKLHLKKNMQWNHRGERYSIPKPMHGSANGRNRGGGKNGWGHDLILAEDQKEYERANFIDRKQKEKSLMDEDYLPSILTGDRSKGGGKIKVGAGRNVNAKKR